MTAPQFIKSPSGEEMVVLSRADYDALVAIAEDAAEDAADARLAAARLAELQSSGTLSVAESTAILVRNGFLRAARKRRGMTQAEVAEAIGIAQGFLSAIEAGTRKGSPQTMAKLAEVLGLPPEQLASG